MRYQVFNKMLSGRSHSLSLSATRQSDCCMPFDVYHDMQADNVNSSCIFVGLIKECTALKDVERGCALHADIARLGMLEVDVFLGSTLVDMYAKCGYVAKSQEVFDGLLLRDVVSWTSLISGYAEHGPCEKAFDHVSLMRQEGVSPNSYTMVSLLKACGHLGAIGKAEEVHTEIVVKGLEGEEFIGNSLVDIYTKCGHLPAAYAVFCSIHVQDVVSWTALILGHVNCGQSKEAIDCYEKMQSGGSSSNIITFICILKVCTNIEVVKKGQQIHADIVFKGFEDDIRIGNTLMDMYFKCGLRADAEMSFAKLPWQNVVSWNILLAGYAKLSTGEEALAAFKKLQSRGLSADGTTYICLLKACSKLRNMYKGMELHSNVTKSGLDQKLTIGNTLIDMYGKSGLLNEAQHIFDKLQVRSLVSWNTLIAGYAEHAHADKALQFLNQMQSDNFCPDATTCVCGLKVCGSMENLFKGQEMHLDIVKLGIEEEFRISNCLVHMYAKCGLLAEAQEIFDKSFDQDVVCWTALMVGWAQFGKTEIVLAMFEQMIREGVTPCSITLTSILNACSDDGVMSLDHNFFHSTRDDSGLVPTLEHYTCIIDLLGRAGLLDKAIRLTKEMPIHPDIVIWLSLLGACRNWGNVELGKLAFDNALQLDKKCEAAYLCMFNIFIEAGMHGEAYAVEVKRAGMEAKEIQLDCFAPKRQVQTSRM